jgi:hypothetical protein
MVKEFGHAINGGFPQIGRRCNYSFRSGRGSECLGVATEHDLYKNIGDVDVCTEFEMLKVKVLIIFLGTVGFLLPREGR